MTLNAKLANFFSAETGPAVSIMALSGVMKYLFLSESLNMYATQRFTLENELFSSQRMTKLVETAVHGKFEETFKPSFRS